MRIGSLRSEHMFIGMVLIPPVLLKLGSTGDCFARYYLGTRAYREKGPPLTPASPAPPLRVITTLLVFATGVALLAVGPRSGLSSTDLLARRPRHSRECPRLPAQPHHRLAKRDGRHCNWTEPLGLASLFVEGAVFAVATVSYAVIPTSAAAHRKLRAVVVAEAA